MPILDLERIKWSERCKGTRCKWNDSVVGEGIKGMEGGVKDDTLFWSAGIDLCIIIICVIEMESG